MLAVDPTLELLATGFHADFTEPWHHWNETLLREGGPHVGSIALHALPGNSKGRESHPDLVALWHDLMAHPHRWEREDLPELLALAEAIAPGRNIDVSITEWGILGDTQRPQVGNMGGAIYAALYLNMSVRLHEVIRVGNATALLHGGGLRKAGPFYYEDPQVEVIRRYTTLAGGERLPMGYSGATYDVTRGVQDVPTARAVPWVDAVAVRKRDGEVVVALVNRSAHETHCVPIQFGEDATFTPLSWEVMTGHMRAMNTPVAPDRVSFVAQHLPDKGKVVTVTMPARGIGWLRGRL
jgi:alpha-L-arabinofuranosidase